MVKYILMPETTIQKIRKGDKFFVNGEFNPNAARLITAAHLLMIQARLDICQRNMLTLSIRKEIQRNEKR